MTEIPFSTRLRDAIAARFGPQKEGWFADHVGMSRTHLSRVLNNPHYRPEIETVRRYADGLGLDPAEVARWIPGYIVPEETAARAPVPAIYHDAFPDQSHLSDAAILQWAASEPDEASRAALARYEAKLAPDDYMRLLRRLYRAYSAAARLALEPEIEINSNS